MIPISADQPSIPEAQQQSYPGRTAEMSPRPRDEAADYVGRGLLDGKVALVTGGDSGIGRATTVAFAKEGADVAFCYLDAQEDEDAIHTAELVRSAGRRCLTSRGDLGSADYCQDLVDQVVAEYGRIDVLVNHAGTQQAQPSFEDITDEQWARTFDVNVHSVVRLVRAALPHLPDGGSIITTGSINGLRGNKGLIDYSATKGAVHVLTYSLAQAFLERGIRVNCVAPGPVWTPLIPTTFPEEKVDGFGAQTPMGRMAHPDELAPSYVFFAAASLSSYYTGQILTPTGGEIHPGG